AWDCVDLAANIGDACDDNNSGTYDDAVNANCECLGIPYDCAELMADFGDVCNDGNPLTVNDLVSENCECIGEPATEASICEIAVPIECNADPVTYSSAESNGTNTTGCTLGDKGLWFSFVGTGG